MLRAIMPYTGAFAFLPLLLSMAPAGMALVNPVRRSALLLVSKHFELNFNSEISRISNNYKWRVDACSDDLAVQRFEREQKPLTPHQIAVEYDFTNIHW